MELLNHYVGKEKELKDNIIKGFDNIGGLVDEVIKSEDFIKDYPKDKYEVYTKENMKEYFEDIQKSINQDESKKDEIISKAEEDLKGISKVNVQFEKGVTSFWVKEKETETENSETK